MEFFNNIGDKPKGSFGNKCHRGTLSKNFSDFRSHFAMLQPIG
jgi:hypothetical protein